MMSRWRFAFRGLLALGAVLAATPQAHADAYSTVEMLRAGGCGGVLPIALPLTHSTLLDRAAAQWAAGEALASASQRLGYSQHATTGMHMTGSESSMVQQLRRAGCSTVLDRSLREVGFYQRGTDTWLVLAWGYAMPVAPGQPQRAIPTPGAQLTRPPPAPSAAVSGVASGTPAYAAAASPRPPQLASLALQLVNDVRARGTRCGGRAFGPAPPLVLSGTLGGVAFGHATDMAAHNYFEHEDLAGHSPADRVRAVGYQEKLVGENIAYGPKSVEEVVQGWLDSPGHCQNIMDPRFVEMGIAFANGQSLSRHGLYWVQLFAEPRA
jgi:uncharacterized protein YkwD